MDVSRTRRGVGAALLAFAACSASPADVPAFSNDPLSPRQGYMTRLGVPDAWSRASGAVVVAVLDDAVDLEHPDLRDELWTNPGEIAANGVDDDGDGHVDDVHGWNFLDDDGDVALSPADRAATDFGHGTSVAGIVGAETNNAVGVASCCPGCALMILKARDFVTTGSVLPRFGAAVDYAIAHGARVLNVSDGALPSSVPDALASDLEAAAARAEQAGLVIVASAGNDGASVVRWPARIPTVLAVAAVDWDGVPTSWTSFGPEVGVAAPGVFVETTVPDGRYDWFDGTSASAPIVSGLAAMLVSEHPDWTPSQIRARIAQTARPASLETRPEVTGLFGAGVVDFAAAL